MSGLEYIYVCVCVCVYIYIYIYERAVGWTDLVKNEVLHRVKEEGNILHAIK